MRADAYNGILNPSLFMYLITSSHFRFKNYFDIEYFNFNNELKLIIIIGKLEIHKRL